MTQKEFIEKVLEQLESGDVITNGIILATKEGQPFAQFGKHFDHPDTIVLMTMDGFVIDSNPVELRRPAEKIARESYFENVEKLLDGTLFAASTETPSSLIAQG